MLIVYFVFYALAAVGGMHPDVPLNLQQRIQRHGYPVELHQVDTRDGYILNMYRVPHGLKQSENEPKNKSVVLLVHAQFGMPHNFVALGRKDAPAYYFADRGFDVWLFCSRGVDCQNPKKHRKLNWNRDPTYWDFSFHEVAIFDLLASIDLILKKTGQRKIFTVCHSVGGHEFFALMSEKPQYNEKIKLNVNYGAAPIIKRMDFPVVESVAMLSNLFKNLYNMMGMQEFLPSFVTEMLGGALKRLCADPKWFKTCKVALWCFGSHISTLMEDDIVEVAFSTLPRISIKQVTHYLDNINRGDFRKYDYGPKKNMALYGTKLPTAYNLSACTVPNAFFYGTTDSISVQEDTWETEEMLPNAILDYEVGPRFVHLDFIFAKNATHRVYEPTVKLFQDFDKGVVPPKVNRKN